MPAKWILRVLWITVFFLVAIGMMAAVRRAIILSLPPTQGTNSNPAAELDYGFAHHPILTFIHIIPGFLFMVLAPLQFVPGIRSRWLEFHRWSGRVVMSAGVVIGVSALLMSFTLVIGGANETVATVLFAVIFLFALIKAYRHIRRGEIARHREWMIRAFAIGLAIATIRPIVGLFFAFRRLSPHEFFGIAFWLGFTLHLLAAEIWINYTRSSTHWTTTRNSDI